MERRNRYANQWHWTENPALNPTRPWEDTEDTVRDLHLLIKGKSAERLALLRTIADGNPHTISPEEKPRVAFWNQMAESFGFVPMIQSDEHVCFVVPEIQEPLRRAFQALDCDHLPKGPQ